MLQLASASIESRRVTVDTLLRRFAEFDPALLDSVAELQAAGRHLSRERVDVKHAEANLLRQIGDDIAAGNTTIDAGALLLATQRAAWELDVQIIHAGQDAYTRRAWLTLQAHVPAIAATLTAAHDEAAARIVENHAALPPGLRDEGDVQGLERRHAWVELTDAVDTFISTRRMYTTLVLDTLIPISDAVRRTATHVEPLLWRNPRAARSRSLVPVPIATARNIIEATAYMPAPDDFNPHAEVVLGIKQPATIG